MTSLEAFRVAWAHTRRVARWIFMAYVFLVICAALVGGAFMFAMMMKAVFR